MAISVNGELIPDALVDREFERLAKSQKAGSPDAARLKLMAACAVVDRVLVRQAAERDPRPVDPEDVEALMRREIERAGCRPGVNEAALRRIAEGQLRLERTIDSLESDFIPPTPEEVATFCEGLKDHVDGTPEKVNAAHIVVHVNEQRGEAEARRLIEEAQVELDRGAPFADVAERYSDCKGDGGDLGWFERGVMVDEFDAAVFALAPGGRSGIFRTPFGYHIAKLRAKGEVGMARGEIEAYLIAKRRHEAMERGLEALRESAAIERVSEAGA